MWIEWIWSNDLRTFISPFSFYSIIVNPAIMLTLLMFSMSQTRIHRRRNGLLTHWGRVTHICVSKLTIIGSDNGLSPGRRQAIIWTNAGILLIGALGTNVSEILFNICTFSFNKMLLKMSSGKRQPSCPCLNVLMGQPQDIPEHKPGVCGVMFVVATLSGLVGACDYITVTF